MIDLPTNLGRPLRIGHMGAAGMAPANSLASIEAALCAGVDIVELDVWSTADGHLVLSHFDWVRPNLPSRSNAAAHARSWLQTARTWRHWPRITRSTLAELRALPQPPPTLAEALDLMRGRALPYLDLRGADMADRLCALLRAGAPDGALLGAGPQRAYHRELALLPELRATSGMAVPLLGRALSETSLISLTRAAIRRARRNGATGLSVEYHLVRPALIEECRREGFFIFAWTVDNASAMGRLAALRIDGIISNRPDLLIETLGHG